MRGSSAATGEALEPIPIARVGGHELRITPWGGSPGERSESSNEALLTFAVGYRYTGTHELYLAVKAGISGNLCSGY